MIVHSDMKCLRGLDTPIRAVEERYKTTGTRSAAEEGAYYSGTQISPELVGPAELA